MKRSPMKRGKPLARSRLKNKQPAGGFPEEVRVKARLRSKGVCEVGSSACTGSAQHFHHRKLRRFKDHSLVNCLHACGPCHALIHDQPELSYMMGWMVRSWQEPVEHLPKKGERWNLYHRPQP